MASFSNYSNSSTDDSSVEMAIKLEETVLNEPPLDVLKKNLVNEVEFLPFNHTEEPIHIFLKIKPIQETNKQQDIVI